MSLSSSNVVDRENLMGENEFTIRIADLNVRFHNRYNLIRKYCADYLTEDGRMPDLEVDPLGDDVFSMGWMHWVNGERVLLTQAEIEYEMTPIYNLYPKLPAYDAFWVHAVLVSMDGEGYAFTAPSGYGKSTQGKNWLKYFPGRAKIINGDEPIFRKVEGEYRAYGTPFCGKEFWNINTSVPLRGLCFLKRGDVNSIERMEPALAYARLVRDSQRNKAIRMEDQKQYLGVLADFLEYVPVYTLICTADAASAGTAYEGMKIGWEDFQRQKRSEGYNS